MLLLLQTCLQLMHFHKMFEYKHNFVKMTRKYYKNVKSIPIEIDMLQKSVIDICRNSKLDRRKNEPVIRQITDR